MLFALCRIEFNVTFIKFISLALHNHCLCIRYPIYKITNRGLVGIGCQWLPMATNNLPIDYQCTIMIFLKNVPIIKLQLAKTNTLFYIGKNIGKTLAIGTMHWQQLVNHWQKSVCENSDLPK